MNFTETKIKGCFLIEPQVFQDCRGSFFETYKKKEFEEAIGQELHFVQDNHSVSKQGVLRGLHFQDGAHAQSKLVRVVKGAVLDVVVDLRKGSPTFGEHMKVQLSAENKKALFIPKGMAHGFLTLTAEAFFVYKCDTYYHQASERGIIYNDETLQIDWNYPSENIILSDKDKELPFFNQLSLG